MFELGGAAPQSCCGKRLCVSLRVEEVIEQVVTVKILVQVFEQLGQS